MIIYFAKYSGLQGCAQRGRVLHIMFHLYQFITGILLRCKPRSCCLVQLPALEEITEIILLQSGVLWSPLQSPGWADSECRFTSEIFTQQGNNISFCVTGASLLALSASVCPKAEIVLLQAGVFWLVILKVGYISFIDKSMRISFIFNFLHFLYFFLCCVQFKFLFNCLLCLGFFPYKPTDSQMESLR